VIDVLRYWVVSPMTGEEFVRDVPVAPEALAARLRGSINKPPKRMLGVLKVTAEWIGVVAGNEFIVWEKRQHATRAVGRIQARRGGSRVQAHIGITRRTRILLLVFVVLFLAGSFGLLAREGGLGLGPAGLTVAAVGALFTLSIYWSASLRQRAALRAFLNDVFRERRPSEPPLVRASAERQ